MDDYFHLDHRPPYVGLKLNLSDQQQPRRSMMELKWTSICPSPSICLTSIYIPHPLSSVLFNSSTSIDPYQLWDLGVCNCCSKVWPFWNFDLCNVTVSWLFRNFMPQNYAKRFCVAKLNSWWLCWMLICFSCFFYIGKKYGWQWEWWAQTQTGTQVEWENPFIYVEEICCCSSVAWSWDR